MGDLLRKEVIKAFRNIHKARKLVFNGDPQALSAARAKINEEFKKNKSVDSNQTVEEMIKYANDVAEELKTTVVQAEEREPGLYELHITTDTQKLNNFPYDPNIEITPKKWKMMARKCCEEKKS